MSDAETSQPFAPISRETVSAQIRSQLLDRIRTGELAPGSKMASERELSAGFGVARTSVREAMQGLVSMGVVERRGNRSYVVEHLPEVIVEPSGESTQFVAALFETRRVLEIPLFALAAERATPEDRTQVGQLAAGFHDELDVAEFRHLDREFHTTIALSSRNPLLIELYVKVLDQLHKSAELLSLLHSDANPAEVRRIISESGNAHRELADAFATGDGSTMSRATESHLDAVERAMIDDRG